MHLSFGWRSFPLVGWIVQSSWSVKFKWNGAESWLYCLGNADVKHGHSKENKNESQLVAKPVPGWDYFSLQVHIIYTIHVVDAYRV